ncbi:MAG: AbrB/MazE/SpoVT family DNA-binding domain-containing protein [Candidatus Saccharimonadales bacterium]
MKNTIKVTSKGRVTIPAEARRKMGLDKEGGVLVARFDDKQGILKISQQITAKELAENLSSYIKPNTKPLEDVDSYYHGHISGRYKTRINTTGI